MERPKSQALGMMETRGLLALVEATDAALKAAQVSFRFWKPVGGGLAASFVVGDVGAVKAAMAAAEGAVRRLGLEVTVHVIARPHGEVWPLVPDEGPGGANAPDPAGSAEAPGESAGNPDQFENSPVRENSAVTLRPESPSPALRAEAKAPMVKDEKTQIMKVEEKAAPKNESKKPPKKSGSPSPKKPKDKAGKNKK